MRYVVLALALLLVAATVPEPPVALSASFHFGFAPASFRMRLRVQPHPDNRAVCVTYDGGQYRSSCWQIDGESPITTWMDVRDLPEGEYLAWADLTRAGQRAIRSAVIRWDVLARH